MAVRLVFLKLRNVQQPAMAYKLKSGCLKLTYKTFYNLALFYLSNILRVLWSLNCNIHWHKFSGFFSLLFIFPAFPAYCNTLLNVHGSKFCCFVSAGECHLLNENVFNPLPQKTMQVIHTTFSIVLFSLCIILFKAISFFLLSIAAYYLFFSYTSCYTLPNIRFIFV